MDKEKIESKKRMRELTMEEELVFPIGVVETVRNNVSLLNAKHYLEGKKWSSKADVKEGIVRVKRLA